MLEIVIPESEFFDESAEQFINIPQKTLKLEHSLVAISKWEAEWEKPFLSKEKKTNTELISYIRCMTITQNVEPVVYLGLTREHIKQINDYIDRPMTATTFTEVNDGKKSNEVVTSEIIYYWMISYKIPLEFHKWHINRLLTLIKIFNIKNAPQKKMAKNDILRRNRELNRKRREQLRSAG